MIPKLLYSLVGLALLLGSVPAQTSPESGAVGATLQNTPGEDAEPSGLRRSNDELKKKLERSLKELSAAREKTAELTLPKSDEIASLQTELESLQRTLQEKTRSKEVQAVEIGRLIADNKKIEKEVNYLSRNLADYVREFDGKLHISEYQRAKLIEPWEEAKRALTDETLSQAEVIEANLEFFGASIGRLEDALSGTVFPASVVNPKEDGELVEGSVLLLGPTALFRSKDGSQAGITQKALGQLDKPVLLSLGDQKLERRAAETIAAGSGLLPLDPTLGDAHKLEETKDGLIEHINKGGNVIWPILFLGALALIIALGKWTSLLSLPRVRRAELRPILEAVGEGHIEDAQRRARKLKGPMGRMVASGVENLDSSRELVEEIMYEHVLKTRLKVQRGLPFIAVTAASAPLLGLLGTVTGIISTFDQINAFGSSDVKNISGGISEALITTEFGLIVAIPSLLLHAFLSRQAKGIVGRMETVALRFVNQLNKAGAFDSTTTRDSDGDPDSVRYHVNRILSELLAPIESPSESPTTSPAARSSSSY